MGGGESTFVCNWVDEDYSKKCFECSLRVEKCYLSTGPFTIY